MAFVHFLKTICLSQEQYLRSLQEGGSHGIPILQQQYVESREKTWKLKKESNFMKYSQEIIKGITGYDLSLKKVDPVIVCSAKTNRDLIKLINLCEIDSSPEFSKEALESLSSARDLLAQCKTAHQSHACNSAPYMQRYYSDALSRLPRALQSSLTSRPL
ncbi:hypothetical protein H0W26_03755 [Candidatus Dependentiae bacterium]|nr:hypothetical protein [Candidatus Dependentiae bacterium]